MPKVISRQAAMNSNLHRYYTGIPCTRGHYSLRATGTGACIECGNKYRTSQKNKDYMRDYNKRVRAAMKKVQDDKLNASYEGPDVNARMRAARARLRSEKQANGKTASV